MSNPPRPERGTYGSSGPSRSIQFGALQALFGMGLVYGSLYATSLPQVQFESVPVLWAGLGFAFTVAGGLGEWYLDDGPGAFLKLVTFAPVAIAIALAALPAVLGVVLGTGVGFVVVGAMWMVANLR